MGGIVEDQRQSSRYEFLFLASRGGGLSYQTWWAHTFPSALGVCWGSAGWTHYSQWALSLGLMEKPVSHPPRTDRCVIPPGVVEWARMTGLIRLHPLTHMRRRSGGIHANRDWDLLWCKWYDPARASVHQRFTRPKESVKPSKLQKNGLITVEWTVARWPDSIGIQRAAFNCCLPSPDNN